MNKTKYIIKRIYSTNVLPRICPSQTFKQIPRCHECVYFSFHNQTCKKFLCKAYIARLDTFKCGLFGIYFRHKL